MATVAESLFGVTPESLQRQRQQQLRQEAMDFASISDPFQQANFAIYQGAGNLARGVGGLLGAQDPELMRVRQRQEMLQGVDIADPAALRQAATVALQNGDNAAAQELARRALDIEKTQAGIAKDVAAANRERKQAIPAKILESQAVAELKDSIRILQAQPETPEIKAAIQRYTDQVAALEPAEKTVNYGSEAERISQELYKKPFSQLTQPQMAAVNKRADATRGVNITNVLPGVKAAGDVTGLRRDIQAITKPYQDQSDAAESAIELANMAIKNGNFAAVSSLSRSLAKAAGETQLSARDVEAFGVDPSLVGRVSDTVSRLAQSRPTVDTLTKLRQVAEALKKKADSRIKLEEDQTIEVARSSKLFTEDQLNTVFRRRPAPTTGSNQKTTRSGVKYTVEND